MFFFAEGKQEASEDDLPDTMELHFGYNHLFWISECFTSSLFSVEVNWFALCQREVILDVKAASEGKSSSDEELSPTLVENPAKNLGSKRFWRLR